MTISVRKLTPVFGAEITGLFPACGEGVADGPGKEITA